MPLEYGAVYSDNSIRECPDCGARSGRLQLIREGLDRGLPGNCGFFASDRVVYDTREIAVGSYVQYELRDAANKWFSPQASVSTPNAPWQAIASLNPLDLHEKWARKVNQGRNDVVHRVNVHFTTDEAMESLRVALEAILSCPILGTPCASR